MRASVFPPPVLVPSVCVDTTSEGTDTVTDNDPGLVFDGLQEDRLPMLGILHAPSAPRRLQRPDASGVSSAEMASLLLEHPTIGARFSADTLRKTHPNTPQEASTLVIWNVALYDHFATSSPKLVWSVRTKTHEQRIDVTTGALLQESVLTPHAERLHAERLHAERLHAERLHAA